MTTSLSGSGDHHRELGFHGHFPCYFPVIPCYYAAVFHRSAGFTGLSGDSAASPAPVYRDLQGDGLHFLLILALRVCRSLGVRGDANRPPDQGVSDYYVDRVYD